MFEVFVMNAEIPYGQQQLLIRVAAGNHDAFRALVNRHGPVLCKAVAELTRNRELAEDITQDVFTQIWLTREALPGIRDTEAYLFILARNRAFDAMKKIGRQIKLQQAWHTQTTEAPEPVSPAEKEVYLTLIEEAIAQLPPQQQTVWILHRREKKKYEAIATELNLSRETVKKYLQLATESIKSYVVHRAGFWSFLYIVKEIWE